MHRLLTLFTVAAVALVSLAAIPQAADAAIVPNSHQVVTLTDRAGHQTTVVANQSSRPGQEPLLQLYRVAPEVMASPARKANLVETLCWDTYSCFFANASGGGQLVRIVTGQGINDLSTISCPVSLGCRNGTFNDSMSSWATNHGYNAYRDSYQRCSSDGTGCWFLYAVAVNTYGNLIPAANDQISSVSP